MRSLTDITVEVEKYGHEDKHTEITVRSVIYDATLDEHAADFGHPTTSQLLAATVQMAGLLGRVSFAAMPWMAYQAQQHRCVQVLAKDDYEFIGHVWNDVCHLSGPASMLGPHDLGDTPALWFYVPDAEVTVWLGRIRRWLEAATAADAYRVEEAAEPQDPPRRLRPRAS